MLAHSRHAIASFSVPSLSVRLPSSFSFWRAINPSLIRISPHTLRKRSILPHGFCRSVIFRCQHALRKCTQLREVIQMNANSALRGTGLRSGSLTPMKETLPIKPHLTPEFRNQFRNCFHRPQTKSSKRPKGARASFESLRRSRSSMSHGISTCNDLEPR
jgi:hypothetical protein